MFEHGRYARYLGHGVIEHDIPAMFADAGIGFRPTLRARLLKRAHDCIIPHPDQLRKAHP